MADQPIGGDLFVVALNGNAVNVRISAAWCGSPVAVVRGRSTRIGGRE
jgi:hypothetical protein